MSEPRSESDEALYKAVCGGDDAALETLLERNWNSAFHIALSFVRDRGLAEDVAQEACLSLLKAADGGAKVQDFAPWFHRLVANQARMMLRSNTRRRRREEKVARKEGQQEEPKSKLREWTRALPQKLRQPIELHFGLGLSHAEVAGMLEAPKSTISSRIQEGLNRIKARFGAKGVALSLVAVGELAGAALVEACAEAPSRPKAAALRALRLKAAGAGISAGAAYGLLALLGLSAALGLALTFWPPAPPPEPKPAPPKLAAAGPGLVRGPGGALYRKKKIQRGRRRMTRYVPVNGQGPVLKDGPNGLVPAGPLPPARRAAPKKPRESASSAKAPPEPARPPLPGELRHGAPVTQLLVDPRGRFLISLGGGDLRGWDLEARQPRFALPAGQAALLEDGRLATYNSGVLSLWDLSGEEPRRLRRLEASAYKNGLVPKLVAGRDDGVVLLRRIAESPKLLSWSGAARPFGPGFKTMTAALSPDGTRLVSFEIQYRPGEPGHAPAGRPVPAGCEAFVLVVWDALRGETLHLMPVKHEGITEAINALAFDNGHRLYTIGSRSLRRWDLIRGEEEPGRRRIEVRDDGSLTCLAAVGADRLAVGDDAGLLRVFDRESFAEEKSFEAHKGAVSALAALRYSRALVSGGADGLIRFWELDAVKETAERAEHRAAVKALDFSAEGARLLSRDERGLAILRGPKGEALARFDSVETSRFAADGSLLLARSTARGARPFERVAARDGQSLGALKAPPLNGMWMDQQLSASGRLARAGQPSLVVDLASGETLFALPEEALGAGVALSADGALGAWVLGPKPWRIEVYDLVAGVRRLVIEDPEIASLARLSAKTRLEIRAEAGLLVGLWPEQARVWSLADGAALWSSKSLKPYSLTADGARLAAARKTEAGWRPVILDAASGRELQALALLEAAPTAMALAPDEGRVAFGTKDGRVELVKIKR